MFDFPSGKPKTYHPANKYTHSHKTHQCLAIQKAQNIQYLKTQPILDLTINELEELLKYT